MMEFMRENATARLAVLMTPTEKSRLEVRAKKAGLSVAEFVRRSVDAYSPEADLELRELEVLAAELGRAVDKAGASADRAHEEVMITLKHLRQADAA